MRCFKSLCPDLKKRYQHSKKAAVKGMEVSKLEIEGNSLGKVSYRASPKETWHPSSKLYEDIESRRSTVENILNALRNPDINMVGVHGMGGIGKTTLAKEVGKQVEEQRLFDALVFVEISEKPDIMKIQGAIADKLGLEFREETESGRARALYERCKKESKLLIILDNIWKGLDLEIVGIPFANDHPGCKLMLTARSIDVLSNDMNSLKNFPVNRLDDKEAQDLFMKVAGACIEQHGLQSLALDVAKSCGGLPIAIVTVAKALKNAEECEWKSALHELQHPSVENLEESVATEAYSCIKLSYDHLKSEELKSTFLLCSTMIFISNASIKMLLRYAMGLRLFNTIDTMEAARDRINTLIQKLKKSSLLLDSPKGEIFFMHDVVRDVGISIAWRDRHMFTMKENLVIQDLAGENTLKNCTYIILHDITELPGELDCPQLEFLYMKAKTRFSKIPDNFFKGMPNLRVLHLIEMVLSPLPASFLLLKKLQTLYLDRCHLGDTVDIGKMKNLKILVLSSYIKQLPEQIGESTRLKVLDLSKCYKLEVIPPNIISRLTQLEELYVAYDFDQWQVEGVDSERSNTSLGELEHLSKLTALQVYIPDAKLVPKGLVFQNLRRYRIGIGVERKRFRLYRIFNGNEYTRKLALKHDDANISVEDGVIKQLKGIEELKLFGNQGGVKNVLYEFNRDGFPKLKHFRVASNPEVVYIVDFPKQSEPCVAFPHLQTLSLEDLSSLEKICHGQFSSPYSFCQLRTITVTDCVKLKNIFSSSIARHLSQLQRIHVCNCENMEEIFSSIVVGGENEEVVLEKLQSLWLQKLPKVRSFSYEEEVGSTSDQERQMEGTLMPFFDGKVQFRNLKTIYLWQINLKYVLSPNSLLRSHNLERLSLENSSYEWIFSCEEVEEYPQIKSLNVCGLGNLKQIWKQDSKVDTILKSCRSLVTVMPPSTSFQNLTDLRVICCRRLIDLISSSTAKSLIQLKTMDIKECGMMTQVVTDDGGGIEDEINFKNLKSLRLGSLRRLTRFCSGNYNINFPSLETLFLVDCPKMRIFSSKVANTPMLREIEIDFERYYCDGDVNTIMERIHEKEVFPSDELTLSANEIKMILQKFPEHKFSKVKTLEVYNDESTVFPLDILQRFQNLNSLQLRDASYKEIFSCEEVEKHAETAQIKHLCLQKLDDMQQIWKQDSRLDLIVRFLESLNVVKCNSLITLMPTSASFPNLRSLKISGCNGLRSLATATVAKSLFQLEDMRISNCNEMTEIVANGDVKEDGIIFNKLGKLTLIDLSNLTCFYSGNDTLNFPSLKKLHVTGCPKMKFFCLGISSTPVLQQIKCDRRKYNLEGDLNTTIQRIHEEMDVENSLDDCADPSTQHLE
ncbi:hypothetical protein Ddye_013953 [Dipteronia dyeriana]|uniref:AAA+ ATPase domain-containing protein n=1 Tax=Dipteronia dyeriana TaxID=168575 RepID=A0AAD9X7B6_9ROSI|nr:hypothetical protein Ddye_013953 [Dipteronia dyeriana]